MAPESEKCCVCGKSPGKIAEEITSTSSVFSVCIPAFNRCETCGIGNFCSKKCVDTHLCEPRQGSAPVAEDELRERLRFDERFLIWQKQTSFLHVLLLRLVLRTASDAVKYSVILHLDYDSSAAPLQHFQLQGPVEKVPDSDINSVHGGSVQKIVSQRLQSQGSLRGDELFVPLVVMVRFPREAKSIPTVVCGCPHLLSREIFDSPVPASANGMPLTVEDAIKLMSKVLN